MNDKAEHGVTPAPEAAPCNAVQWLTVLALKTAKHDKTAAASAFMAREWR